MRAVRVVMVETRRRVHPAEVLKEALRLIIIQVSKISPAQRAH